MARRKCRGHEEEDWIYTDDGWRYVRDYHGVHKRCGGEYDGNGYYYEQVPTYGANIGNVQGGWKESKKYKDKDGNWVTRTAWGSGKAGW